LSSNVIVEQNRVVGHPHRLCVGILVQKKLFILLSQLWSSLTRSHIG